MARVRRACSPQCSPVRALRRCNFTARTGSGAAVAAAPSSSPGSPNGSPRHSPSRFGFLLRESLVAAAANSSAPGVGNDAVTQAGNSANCTSPVSGRRLSDVLIDEEDDQDDGKFAESWAPSCGGSPMASPGTGRRRISDLFIDEGDSDGEPAAEASLKWGDDNSD